MPEKSGKKNRKFGRNSERSDSMKLYRSQGRDKNNQKKAVAKQKAFEEEKKENPPKVAKGTARAERRASMNQFKAEQKLQQELDKSTYGYTGDPVALMRRFDPLIPKRIQEQMEKNGFGK